jgi:aryl-alcohol dehydrogenase-like predicted oxidoreductase
MYNSQFHRLISARQLGKTRITVSRIGLGTVKFGRTQGLKYPRPFSLPTDRDVQRLLSLARSGGINLLDTAPAYGASEERIGNLLPGPREDWIIVTKCGEEFFDGKSIFDFSPGYLRSSLLRSLTRLRTNYVDVLLVHSNGNDKAIIDKLGVFDTLANLKKEGLVKAIGISAKTAVGAREAMKWSDVLMLSLNPLKQDMIEVIQEAQRRGVGVLTKHTLNSGRLDHLNVPKPLEACLDLALRTCAVDTALVGTSSPTHLTEILDTAISITDSPEAVADRQNSNVEAAVSAPRATSL